VLPDLLSIQLESYRTFLSRLAAVVREAFPWMIDVDGTLSLLGVEAVRAEAAPPGDETNCLQTGIPYRLAIEATFVWGERTLEAGLLGFVPALTSHGCFFYGQERIRERVAIAQLLPCEATHWENPSANLEEYRVRCVGVYLEEAVTRALREMKALFDPWRFCAADVRDPHAVALTLQGSEAPRVAYLRDQQFPEETHQLLQVLRNEDTPLGERRRAVADYLNRVLLDGELYSSERFPAENLTGKVKRLLQQPPGREPSVQLNRLLLETIWPGAISRSRGSKPLQLMAEGELKYFLLPSLPEMFTTVVERHLYETDLVQPLDKTNPLAEICHKRKITFCGRGGVRNLAGDKPQRRVHFSHYGRLCPVETPESEKVGLNLHFALGARVEAGIILAGDQNLSGEKSGLAAGADTEASPEDSASCLGAGAALIPFVAHDDMIRAMMAIKNMKQALPLLHAEPPLVKTGFEPKIARESRCCLLAERAGQIVSISTDEVVVRYEDAETDTHYPLLRVPGSQGTGSFYRIRSGGEGSRRFSGGEVLADGSATINGELSLGVNLLVAYMPWYGWNFEDAVVVSERAATLLTSLHLKRQGGRFEVDEKKLEVGDKIAGRHGNKGVVSRILPVAAMPHLVTESGRVPVDIILNPHGILSRMNLGQLLETHCGWIAAQEETTILAPPFVRADLGELGRRLEACGLPGGKGLVEWEVPDGETQRAEAEVVVGYQYFLKLNHLAAAKLHVRGTGRRAAITLQPVRGKQRGGGQRVGEMEVWALQAHGAKPILQEILTVKSDVVSEHSPIPIGETLPESFRALVMHLRGCGIDTRLILDGNDGSDEEFPLDRYGEAFDPDRFKRVEVRWASEETIRSWGKEVTDARYKSAVYRCEDCGATFRRLQKGGRVCRQCGRGTVKTETGRAPNGLFGDEVFGPDAQMFQQGDKEELERARHRSWRSRMGYIRLAEPVPHPLSEDRQMTLVPIIPPAYRPLPRSDLDSDQPLEDGLNRAYRHILIRNATLARILKEKEEDTRRAETYARSELIKAVGALFGVKPVFDESWACCGYERIASSEQKNNLRARIEGKAGLVRGHLLGKRVDYSGRAVIIPDPTLPFGYCRLPREAASIYKNAPAHPPVLLNRAPSLHRYNFQAFLLPPVESFWVHSTIGIHPLVCGGFGADFDGDTMAFHLPETREAADEASDRLLATKHLLSIGNGQPVLHLAQDIVAGTYLLSRTEEGRQSIARLFNEPQLAEQAEPLVKTDLQGAVWRLLAPRPPREEEPRTLLCRLIDQLMNRAFQAATEHGLSFSIFDFPVLDGAQKQRILDIPSPGASRVRVSVTQDLQYDDDQREWDGALREECGQALLTQLRARLGRDGPADALAVLLLSGARGEPSQLGRMGGIVTMIPAISGSYVDGLTPLEYFGAAMGARRDLVDNKLLPALTGAFTRRLVYLGYPVEVQIRDCGCEDGLDVPVNRLDRFVGRVAAQPLTGIIARNEVISGDHVQQLSGPLHGSTFLSIRSPVLCQAQGGICQRCYGLDPSTGTWPEIGMMAGIIAAQSIGERLTQTALKAKHGTRSGSSMPQEHIQELFDRGYEPEEGISKAKAINEALSGLEGLPVDQRHVEVLLRETVTREPGGCYTFLSLRRVLRRRGGHTPGVAGVVASACYEAPLRRLLEALAGEDAVIRDDLSVAPSPLLLGFQTRAGRKGEQDAEASRECPD
jgi:DNA-directed RNA polymerase beta' subunit